MRIYKTIREALDETARDLKVRGITTECKSYQDKKLDGDYRFVKELIGVDFKISDGNDVGHFQSAPFIVRCGASAWKGYDVGRKKCFAPS